MKIRSQEFLVVVAVLIASAVIRVSATWMLSIEPVSDAASYMNMATTMLATGDMVDLHGNVAFFSSGYPLFLIPFFQLFGIDTSVVEAVNIVLGVLSVLLVYLCAKKVLPTWRWAVLPTALWAIYPPAILYSEYVAKENLMILLLLLQALLLLNFSGIKNQLLASLALGLVFGLELLVGPAVMATGLICALILSQFSITNVKKSGLYLNWRNLLCWALGIVIVLSPWLSYTENRLGKAVLNTNSGFNLYLGNNPASSVYFTSIADTPIGPDWESLREEKGELGASDKLKELAIQHMVQNPVETVMLSIQKTIYFWMPPVHAGKGEEESTIESIMRKAWFLMYVLIIAFSLVPLFQVRRLTKEQYILYFSILLYCGIHAAAYIIFRYRLPIMPMVCILAGLGFYYFTQAKMLNKGIAKS